MIRIRGNYENICRLASRHDSVFETFKILPGYRVALEHLNKNQGQDYLNTIRTAGAELLWYFSKFQENDNHGNPLTFRYDVGRFSPTTLRYVKVVMDLKNMFGNLNDFDIVEIGAGYGGQCKIISDVFAFGSYEVVDLDRVLPLIKKYLKRLDVHRILYSSSTEVGNVRKDYDLVISNFAFSEQRKKTQDLYVEHILSVAKRGYITHNSESLFDYTSESIENLPYSLREIISILSVHHRIYVLDEIPKTGNQNAIVVWDDTRPLNIKQLAQNECYRFVANNPADLH